jgi:Pyruvate/2-oxoacid:ferredoxin oxidoreductase gamma subunit
VRAYVRVGDEPITNRNKVYRPDHLLVLDRSLLTPSSLAGLRPGGLLLVNTPRAARPHWRRWPPAAASPPSTPARSRAATTSALARW